MILYEICSTFESYLSNQCLISREDQTMVRLNDLFFHTVTEELLEFSAKLTNIPTRQLLGSILRPSLLTERVLKLPKKLAFSTTWKHYG